MYTAVLMLAMTSGAESVDFGRRGGCNGGGAYACSGFYGGCGGYRAYGGCSVSYGCSGYGHSYSSSYYHGYDAPYFQTLGVLSPHGTISMPARIVVTVPADSRVIFDGHVTTSYGPSRTFTTPLLETGLAYAYSVRVETFRDGRPVTEARQVIVRGGETTVVRLDTPGLGATGRVGP